MSNDVRCPRCGTLLLSSDCLEQIRDKIADENLGMAKCILACPKCQSKFGVVMACDQTGLVVLLVSPQKTEKCFNELRRILQEGLTIAAISQIVNNSRKPTSYISFL
jgi:DNA-directed RNA polymerase subunit RPC12/RpoP